MSRQVKICLAVGLVILAAILGSLMAYLSRQGLDKASLWASYLGLPVTVVVAVSGVWAVVLAAMALRGGRREEYAAELPARPGVGLGSGAAGNGQEDVTGTAHSSSGKRNLRESPSLVSQINEASAPGASTYGVINGDQYIHRREPGCG